MADDEPSETFAREREGEREMADDDPLGTISRERGREIDGWQIMNLRGPERERERDAR